MGIRIFGYSKINGTPIGQDTPAAGAFTTLQGKYQDGDDKTDTYNITSADFGKSLRMNSASDKIFTFPSVGISDDGAILNFENINTGKLTLQMVDSDKIHDSGATCTIYTNDDFTATLSVRYCHVTVTWLIINGFGTWTTTV